MQTIEAIRELDKRTTRSMSRLSRLIGRSRCYLGNMSSKHQDCGCSVMAEIAQAVGWSLVLVNDSTGERIEITPKAS